jgi:hypothetical protein
LKRFLAIALNDMAFFWDKVGWMRASPAPTPSLQKMNKLSFRMKPKPRAKRRVSGMRNLAVYSLNNLNSYYKIYPIGLFDNIIN